MTGLPPEQLFTGAFIALITLLAVSQVIRGFVTGKVLAPSSSMRTKDRVANPFGFWASMVYYIIWILGAIWVVFAYLSKDLHLPF